MMIKSTKSFFSFVLCSAIVLIMSNRAQAQDDAGKLLANGLADGKYLLTGYVDPFVKTLSLGLNQGWYNTAKPHKVAGVDLTITAAAMYVPSSSYYYTVDNSKLNRVELLSGPNGAVQTTPTKVPTIFGPDAAPTYRPKGDTDPANEFQGPPGIDLKKNVGKYLPVPMATLGFGLPKSIEVRVRFTPQIKLGDDGNFNLFGIGVMHDIKQYLPGIKLLPFDLSAFVGYTHMSVSSYINRNDPTSIQYNEKAVFEVNSTTIQGVISKKVSVLTGYASVGYNIAKSKAAFKGVYDYNKNEVVDAGEKDPLTLNFAASGPRVSAGLRLKLLVFTFHADYTVQKYSSLTVGFGINVR